MKTSPGDIIILHMSTINKNHIMYDSWDMEFFALLPLHPLTLLNNPKNQNFEKMKKNSRDIVLHKCTINDNHMIYDSWDINCNRQIFFVILGVFLPFYPPNSPKNKNFKKMKKTLKISLFYRSAPRIMIIDYTIPEIWHVTNLIVIFHFGLVFALLPP